MRYAVILAGGWGERLWPMSTRGRPKQLLKLADDSSLVSRTLERVAPLVEVEESLALTSMNLSRQMIAELGSLPRERVVGEPVGRNTAPAIALAAHLLVSRDPDALLVVLPADHVIGDDGAFREAIDLAARAAEGERALVTLGIPPDRAETEYGYIKAGEPAETKGVLRVEMFTEKPDIETAESFLADGRYFWNSGMFIWRADRFLEEVGRQLPEIAAALGAVTSAPGDPAFEHELETYYGSVPSISVDYGVMEGAQEVLVVPTRFSWDDVGAWSALGRVWTSNARGNAVRGDSLLIDSEGCVVYSEGGVVAVVGLTDVVVAHTPGATLVCPKDRARDVRRVVDELKRRGSIRDSES
jgi:mannose-1-phosphate guanylyltransferase